MKKDRKFPAVKDGEWVQPVMRRYYMACCDCDLVHRMDFRIVKGTRDGKKIERVQFRASRAPAKTRIMRTLAKLSEES